LQKTWAQIDVFAMPSFGSVDRLLRQRIQCANRLLQVNSDRLTTTSPTTTSRHPWRICGCRRIFFNAGVWETHRSARLQTGSILYNIVIICTVAL